MLSLELNHEKASANRITPATESETFWGFPDCARGKGASSPAKAGDIETWVRNLGREDPLEEGMATHSSILAWTIPRTEEPGGLQSIGLQRVGHD